MAATLALVTTCKPLEGKFAAIQRNALRSWKALSPPCPVLVCGDEAGVKECCKELDYRHVPDVPRSPFGTPLLDGLVDSAEQLGKTELIGLVNADIMLTGDLLAAVEAVRMRFERFLLIARRWTVDLDGEWDFEKADWESRLRHYAREYGSREAPYGGADLFVFPRGALGSLPPFAIGRTRWDSAIIYRARKLGLPVVDATAVVTCIHQNHDYSHHPGSAAGVYKGPEALGNEALLGGPEFIFSALNATHVLLASGLRRRVEMNPAYLLRTLATLPALHPSLRPLSPLIGRFAPWWRWLRRVGARIKELSRILRRVCTVGVALRSPRRLPCPITVTAEPRYLRAVPPGGGVECFDTLEAKELNHARIEHLRSLNLPLQGKRVVDVGCGVGHLAQFFVEQGCKVLCVDAREENIARLAELYPDLEARVFDLERDDVHQLGRFAIGFAYGLLYHLENPFRAIRALSSICDELLLLETMIADHPLPLVRLAEETSTYSQAMQNIGSRPTPSFVVMALRAAGFRHVYAPFRPPAHRDFSFSWKGDLSDARDGHLLRCTFVASRQPIASRSLVSLL